jgi:cation diffusion facilitator CzcD-associated flavoprotein CzcO
MEAAPSVGGTWYWNRYPGARCDVESVDYSYSFDEYLQDDWTWSERFAAQPEILAYLDHVADRFDLRRHYRFETEVVGARFDAGEWVVETSKGESYHGRFLLCATGCLSAVNRPDLPGLLDFAGEVYYTAAWPREDPDLRGKKIGVIGTGVGHPGSADPGRRGGVVGGVSALA